MGNTKTEDILSRKGVRPTPNRILVMKTLMQVSNPVSLADLERLLGFTMDKASIFRVLELFAGKDIIHVIEDGSRSQKYELCGGTHHSIDDLHAHFYCEHCKKTFCFSNVHIPMIDVPDGFLSYSINYMIKGICPKCRKR